MKKFYILFLTVLTSFLLASCQDEDFGFTEEEVFKGAYARNFEAKYGKINPNQSWDLSTHACTHHHATRALGDPYELVDNYYPIQQGTINWIDSKMTNGNNNSALGSSFGMLMAGEDFVAIPIYQNGLNPGSSSTSWNTTSHKEGAVFGIGGRTVYDYDERTVTEVDMNWTLNMIVLMPGADPVTVPLWSKSTTDNLQTIKTGTAVCDICNGLGMIGGSGNVPCKNCNSQGWLPGTEQNCPICNNVKTVLQDCSHCDANRLIKCTNCDGEGVYRTKFLGITIYNGCDQCSIKGHGWSFFESWGRDYSKGNGKMTCTYCNTDKKERVKCPFCDGVGTMKKCPVCNGEGTGILCTNCNDGVVGTAEWEDLPEPNLNSSESTSKIFRSSPWDKSKFTGYTNGFPEGSILYFILETTKTTTTWKERIDYKDNVLQEESSKYEVPGSWKSTPVTSQKSSLSNNMIVLNCPRPNNIVEGSEVMIIGCEEDSSVDKDYNDLVFLIVGRPLPTIFDYKKGEPVVSTITKRYMIEDMGSSVDWDFNDIVIDVTQNIKRYLEEDNGRVKGMRVEYDTKGKISWLCGTIPLQVTIGSTTIPSGSDKWITDPTDMKQTVIDLEGSIPNDAEFPSEPQIGWGPGYKFDIEGWNANSNNITIKAKHKGSDGNETIWSASFPAAGTVPYIIATDIDEDIMPENKNIPRSWFTNPGYTVPDDWKDNN